MLHILEYILLIFPMTLYLINFFMVLNTDFITCLNYDKQIDERYQFYITKCRKVHMLWNITTQ